MKLTEHRQLDERNPTTRPVVRNSAGPWSDLGPLDRRLRSRWLQWMDGPQGHARRTLWSIHDAMFDGWAIDSLADPESSPETDRMQAALVTLAQRGDVDAAHTLLLQLRPALLTLVRLAYGHGGSKAEVCAEIQSAFFESLFRHPIQRRPTKIAANLVLDTRSRTAFGGGRRSRSETGIGKNPRSLEVVEPDSEIDRGLSALLVIRSVLEELPGTADSRRLTAVVAFRAWILDEQPSNIADDLGLKRQAVVTRLYRLRIALHEANLKELLAA